MEAGQLGTRTTGSAHFVGINFIPVNTQTLLMDWLAKIIQVHECEDGKTTIY